MQKGDMEGFISLLPRDAISSAHTAEEITIASMKTGLGLQKR
jgi:hypothetical protein